MPSRLLCARFPHLGLVAAWRRHPELRGEPVVLGGRPALRIPVLAASEAARAAGVRPGQPLRQAQQLCPAATFLPLDQAAVIELRDGVLTALREIAPAVELGDDEAYCDLSGRHVRFRDETAWAVAVARALTAALEGAAGADRPPTRPGAGLAEAVAPAVGVAGTRLVARMAAEQAVPHRVRRIPPGEEAAFLAPLPLGVLPVDEAVLTRLATLGIDRVGEAAALSPADLRRQFGAEGMALHRCARGEDGGLPLRPQATPQAVVERLVLEGPV